MKRYKLVWAREKQYRDFNSKIIALILWRLTKADHLLDMERELVIKTR